ncbi:methyltransferase domain-containing protein [Roseococcus sp. YIM B11640]|uniref:class I SAM-dependent methyltransferase n=1 Tax=Roseococcus sp. YIM B11640 TaxID=3133973 RepID=UPI003C7DEEB7
MPMTFDGERMTTELEGQVAFEHYHRYCLARDFCSGLDVLDVASGEGYGTALLAGVARSVVGVEINADAVAHAQRSYASGNLRYLQGDATALPLPDASVDVVVSFETLEHLQDQEAFVREVRRVLRPGGLFLVSTPDRLVYSAPGLAANPYHVLELTGPEFSAFLDRHFAHHTILGQRALVGTVMAPVEAPARDGWRSYERRGQEIIEAQPGLSRAFYLIAAASDGPLPPLGSSIYAHAVHPDALIAAAKEYPVQLAAMREDRDRIATAYAEEHGALTDIRSQLAAIQGELSSTQATLAASEQARSETEAALMAARTEAQRAASALETMRASTAWRITRPLRRLASRAPGAARFLRQAAQLAWWTITLQLPHRLRERRTIKP